MGQSVMGLRSKNNPVLHKLEGAREERDSQLAKHPKVISRKIEGTEHHYSPSPPSLLQARLLKGCLKQETDIDNPHSKHAWQAVSPKGGPMFHKVGGLCIRVMFSSHKALCVCPYSVWFSLKAG